jgi:NADH-quinone oxidoreductase subunit L
VWLSTSGGATLWTLAVFGSFLTAAYTFRLFLIVFFGPEGMKAEGKPSRWMTVPTIVLATVAILAGIPDLLDSIFGWRGFYTYLHSAMPGPVMEFQSVGTAWAFQAIYVAVSLAAIALMVLIYQGVPAVARRIASAPIAGSLHRWWFADWGFDWLYAKLIVGPYIRLADFNRGDFVDLFYRAMASVSRGINRLLSWTVNGSVRWYVAGVAGGAVIIVGFVVILWY